MKYFSWDQVKNEKLKRERDISFEDVTNAIEDDKILEVQENPNKKKYPHQKRLIIKINDYVYMVPYVEDEEKYFLKTIIPSRKLTKFYLKSLPTRFAARRAGIKGKE